MNKKKTRINLLLEIIFWLVSIVTIYPMLMVLLTSFKNKGEAAYMNISLPSEWHPENYIAVLEKDFIRSLGNSVFITFISVALIVSLSAFLSFIIVRRDTKGCRIGYKIITLGIIAPFAALPTIQLCRCCTGFPAGDPGIHFCTEMGDRRYDSRRSKRLIC